MNSRSSRFAPLLLALATLASSGCFWVTTKHEGKQIKKDVARIDAELKGG